MRSMFNQKMEKMMKYKKADGNSQQNTDASKNGAEVNPDAVSKKAKSSHPQHSTINKAAHGKSNAGGHSNTQDADNTKKESKGANPVSESDLHDMLEKAGINKQESVTQLNSKITSLERNIVQLKEALLREKATIENIKRRHQQEISNANSYALSKFATDMTDVMENLIRAEFHLSQNEVFDEQKAQNTLEGVNMTAKLMQKVFEKYGIERIYPLNQPFDHRYHQAMSQVETKDHKDDVVVEVLQAGYSIKERLIKPALVVVSKNTT